MSGNSQITPVDSVIIKGVLSNAVKLMDKALLLEKELGLDVIYAMIAMGQPLINLCTSIGLSTFEMEYILKRTPSHRKQYINAKTMSLSESSIKVLEAYSGAATFEQESAIALKHHSNMLDKSIKILNQPDVNTGTGNIVVNNTVVVRDVTDIPALPNELKNVMEGENVNTKS